MQKMKLILSISVVVILSISNICAADTGSDFHLDKNISVKNNGYTSRAIKFDHPMDRAVLSWNAATPEDSYIEFLLRAKSEKSGWSNWFKMGVWGENIEPHSVKGQKTRFGKVDIDTLELKEASLEWQYKIVLHNGRTASLPKIYSIGLAVKNSRNYKKDPADAGVEIKPLKVPRFSQFETATAENRPDLGKRICSPTSVTMLLAYNGIDDLSPLTVAAKVYDHGADAYGNWSFNTAAMFNYLNRSKQSPSFVTYVRWYESFDELMDNVRKKEPVIVSISFKDGELKGAPKPTAGHLVLVKGADKKYVYVNDPAAPDKRSVARKYLKDEFIRAWKGVAYIAQN